MNPCSSSRTNLGKVCPLAGSVHACSSQLPAAGRPYACPLRRRTVHSAAKSATAQGAFAVQPAREGTWLIGWYGGEDHFSWLRITSSSGDLFRGELAVLAEPSIPAGVPYWQCSGSASWELPTRPLTLDLRLEAAGCAREALVFEWFRPTSWRGAFLEAGISGVWLRDGGYGPTEALTGMKYSDDVCNADFTVCKASP